MIPLQQSFIKYTHSSVELVCHPYSLLEFIIISFLLLFTLNQRDAILILILGMKFGSESGPQYAYLSALLRSVVQICPYSLATDNIYHVALLWLSFSPVLGQRKSPIRPLSGNPNHGGPTCTRTNELVLYQETSI